MFYNIGYVAPFLFLFQASTLAQNDTLIFSPITNQVLRNCEIRNLIESKDGKLWLSTNKGVASFDGNDVRFFGHKESDLTTMWTSSISFLNPCPDDKENLFVVTVSGPTYYLNTKTGKTTLMDIASNNPDNYAPKPYSDICIANDSSIWLARYNGGFVHYEIKSNRTTFFTLVSATNKDRGNVVAIRKDKKNDKLLWLATNNGIYSFSTNTEKLQRNFKCGNTKDSSEEDMEILTMDVSNADTIWFTVKAKGVGCYDIKKGTYTIFSYGSRYSTKSGGTPINIKYLQRKNSSEYYIGMTESLPGTFNTFTHQYSFKSKINKDFPGLEIQSFISDSLGYCWCLIFGQLFYACDRKERFAVLPISNQQLPGNSAKIFKTILWDQNKQIYYAAFDNSGGICVFDKNIKFVKLIQGPGLPQQKQSAITDIGLDNNNRLWMSGDILSIYDSLKGQMKPVGQPDYYQKLPAQRCQNLVFRENYLFIIPSEPSAKCIYKINTNTFTCDSILLPPVMLDRDGKNQFGVLEIDSKCNYAYISNKASLYQYNLLSGAVKLVKDLGFTTKTFEFFPNFHWYEIDDDNNLWVSSVGTIRVYEPKSLKILRKIRKDPEAYLLQSANFSKRGIMGFVNSTGIELFDYRKQRQYKLSISDGLVTNINSGVACANQFLFVGAALNALQFVLLNAVIDQHPQRSCYLSKIQIFNGPFSTDTLPEYLNTLKLPHDKNFVNLTFSSTEFEQPERLEYRYKLSGVDKDWVYSNYLDRTISYPDLKPGIYTFYIAVKNNDGSWTPGKKKLQIYIISAWWQTTWFSIASVFIAALFLFWLVSWRIKTVRRSEKQNAKIEKEILELEAKALRAQMNPHFVFNCLNSIKSLIQQREDEKAIDYLTTFSKLIRTLFNNADKKQISLYDEIETCKLYLELEKMRFDEKFSYTVDVAQPIDLKSVQVPALIIQPFIENAIWHGIVPRNTGGNISLKVLRKNEVVEIIIDDDGIGREASQQNRALSGFVHQSKGVYLTQARLELNNFLQQRQAELQIIDKKDSSGFANGTTAIIKIKETVS